MSDNAKNGIIDLTEIVEMGTPPEEKASAMPIETSDTVDFEKELEDLFTSSDFSEFTPSDADTTQDDAATAAAEPAAVDDILTNLDEELKDVVPEPLSTEGDAEGESASADEDFANDFGADFEDLLNDLSEPTLSEPEKNSAPVDFEEDLAAMEAPTSSILDDISPAQEPDSTDVPLANDSIDDLFNELGLDDLDAPASEPVEVAPVSSTRAASDEISIEDPFDVDSLLNEVSDDIPQPAPTEDVAAPELAAAPAAEASAPATSSSLDDDTFDLAALDDLLDSADDGSLEPRRIPDPADGVTAEGEEVDMDDIGFLLSELDDLDQPVSYNSSAPAQPVAETKEDKQPAAQDVAQETFDLDALADDMPADIPAHEATEPASAEPASAMLLEEAEAVAAQPQKPAEPIDGSFFDAEIDALLDDLEMASAEAVEPLRNQVDAVPENPVEPATPETASVEAGSAMENVSAQEQQAAPEEILLVPDTEEVLAGAGEIAAAADDHAVHADDLDMQAVDVPSTEPTVAEQTVSADDISIDALLENDVLDIEAAGVASEAESSQPVEEPQQEATQSPLGSPDEFESILNELDSLIDEQGATAAPEMEAHPVESSEELFEAAGTLDDVAPAVEEPAQELAPEATEEMLGAPTTLEEDLDSTLDRILGDDPLATDEMVVERACDISDEQGADVETITATEAAFPDEAAVSNEMAAPDELPAPEEAVVDVLFEDDHAEEADAADAVSMNSAQLLSEAPSIDDVMPLDEPLDTMPEFSEAAMPEQEVVTEPIDSDDMAAESVLPDDLAAESEEPSSVDMAYEAPAVQEEPASFTHEDIDALFEQADQPEETAFDQPEASELIEDDALSNDVSADQIMPEAEEPAPQEMQNPFDAVHDAISIQELEESALTDLETLAERPENPQLDMDAIEEDAAPVPPDASIEDLMRQSTAPAPDFSESDESYETVEDIAAAALREMAPAFTQEQAAAAQQPSTTEQDAALDEVPVPTMTPEEFAELTERIYYLESNMANLLEMQQAQQQEPPVIDKAVLKEAIDEAFDMKGKAMIRILQAVEIRTESMIEAMGTKIESDLKAVIDKAAAKSAAQVIREELLDMFPEE